MQTFHPASGASNINDYRDIDSYPGWTEMQNMRTFGLILCLAITGCSGEEAAPPREVPKWTKGQENSMVLSSTTPLSKSIVRCWPYAGGYDCLDVGEIEGVAINLSRYSSSQLPDRLVARPAGYHCSLSFVSGTVTEEISREGPVLTSNDYGGLAEGAPWSKAHVEKFMKANGIVAQSRYFACDAIAKVINGGSIDSVNSTVVTHAMLDS